VFLNQLLVVGSRVAIRNQQASGIKLPDFSLNGADLAAQLGSQLFEKGRFLCF
jgi:hypothetical protein